MRYPNFIAICGAATVLLMTLGGSYAADEGKYPDIKGQWQRFAVPGLGPSFDQTKDTGFAQQAPLTPEYRAVLEASLADQAAGGQGGYKRASMCIADGMPASMSALTPIEFLITPEATYVLVDHRDHTRRLFTDGRDWPQEPAPNFNGYSIGHWIDEDGDGRYDVLEVETRGPFKGPRVYDSDGLPLHHDNQSIFKERIFLDKANPNILHDEITVIDNALTRPWTTDKRYRRNPNPRPEWDEYSCPESNADVFVGNEHYYLSADGFLMPTGKNQKAPDSRYFNRQ